MGPPSLRYLHSGRDGQLRPSGVEPAPHAASAAPPGTYLAAAPIATAPAAGRQAGAAKTDGRAAAPCAAATATATAATGYARIGRSRNHDSAIAGDRNARAHRRSAPPGSPVGAAERRYPPIRAATSGHVPRLARQGAGREPAGADDVQQGDPDASAERACGLRRRWPSAHGNARPARDSARVVVARVAARRALKRTALLAAARLVALNDETARERGFTALGARRGAAGS